MSNESDTAMDIETTSGRWEEDDDAAEIRYSLTALGEAVVAADPRAGSGRRFSGFGPCIAVA